MLRVPFRFLEGCLIAARAIESKHVFVYIRGEYEREFEVLVDALEQMRKEQAPRRRDDRPPPRRRRVHLRRGDGAARVARGQARPAAHEAAVPRDRRASTPRRRRSTTSSRSRPCRRSSRWAAPSTRSSGSRPRPARASSRSRATSSRPGNYELPHGFPLQDLIYDVGGGIADGPDAQGRDPRRLVDPDPHRRGGRAGHARLRLARAGRDGDRLGGGDRDRRPRAAWCSSAIRVSQFYEHESCGKCTPCRVGTRWLTQILKKIEAGRGTHADLDLLLDVGERINGTCLCPLGDSDAIAVASYVAKFRDEFLAPHRGGRLPVRRRARRSTGSSRPTRRPRRRHAPAPTSNDRAAGSEVRRDDASVVKRHDRRPRGRGREGHGARRDGGRRGDRDPGVLLRAAARAAGRRLPHVPRRGRGAAEAPGGLHARPRRTGWSCARPRRPSAPPTARTGRSSSSSSTTRSTARSATRAASARCRT